MGNADGLRYALSDLFFISGQHDQLADPLLFQTGQHSRNIRADTVGNDNGTKIRCPLRQIQCRSQNCRRRAHNDSLLVHKLLVADIKLPPHAIYLHLRMNAVAGNLFHLADAAGICFFTIGLFYRLRDWMVGIVLSQCRQLQKFFFPSPYR